MADAIWLDVLPSLAGFASELTRGTAGPAAAAGRAAGEQWSDAMQSGGVGGAAALVADLERASKESAATVGKLANTISTARAAELAAAANLILAEQKLIDVREKYGDQSAQARAAEIRLESAREKAEATSIRYTAAEDQLKAAQRERREITSQLEEATAALANETEDLSDEVDGQESMWSRFRSALSGSEEDADGLGGSLGALVGQVAAAAGAAAVFAEAWSTGIELDSGVAKIAASLDLTAADSEKAGDVAGSLYANAYGESMSEVTDSVATVMSTIAGMRTASAADLEEVTGAAMTMASVFDLDVADAANAANLAISNGLAPDAMGAIDLISASLQKVPEALRGDVIDAANEYGGVLSGLGLTGEQAFAMLVDASANGTIAIDKVGDVLKEFSINVGTDLEGKTPIFEQIGLDAGEMSRAILAGGDQAEDALKRTVGALQAIEDPSARATAAIGLFGTPLEDLGVTEIPAFLDSLSAMDSGIDDVAGTTSEMADLLDDNVASSFEGLKRGFMGAVTEGIEPMIEPAQKILDWVKAVPGGFEAAAIGIAALGIGVAAYTVAQWAMNTAMFASPIFWVVAAIGVLIAGIVLLAQNWETVTTFLTEKWDVFTTWLGESLGAIGGWFSEKFDWLKTYLSETWDSIYVGATGKLQGLLDWIGGVPGWFMDRLSSLGNLGATVTGWVSSASEGARNKFGELLGFVVGIPGSVLSALGNTGSLLKNAGTQIITGFWNGLKEKFEDVKDWVGGVGSWIADHKGPKAYDLQLLVPAGGWIMQGLRNSLEAEIPALENTLDKVSNRIRIDASLADAAQIASASASATASMSARSLGGAQAAPAGATRTTSIRIEKLNAGAKATDVIDELRWAERTAAL